MANVNRVHYDNLPVRPYPVKGSVAQIEVGDFIFFDSRFQGNTSQDTIRPASSGSAGSTEADGRVQFATLFVGVARGRHDLNAFDKNMGVSVDAIVEATIANSVGTATAVTADFDPGTNVGIAVTASFVPIDDRVVVSGHGSVTVADNEAIGKVSHQVKNGDATVRFHLKGMHVFSQTGI